MATKRQVVAVVDDDLGIRHAMSRLLLALGYGIELYASAREFLDATVTSEAICLIVDIELGESRGFELARHVADACSTKPIIFMTGNANETVKKRAMEIGCVALLSKPFAADVLIEALANISACD
jgi:FixJ family two-component response regulator